MISWLGAGSGVVLLHNLTVSFMALWSVTLTARPTYWHHAKRALCSCFLLLLVLVLLLDSYSGWQWQNLRLNICIAANPPGFFVVIRKSTLEYTFPNDELFFRIMKIQLFSSLTPPPTSPPCSVDDSMSACGNQHSCCVFWFCMLQFVSHSCAYVPFSSASGSTPPSRTLPH